MYKRFVGITASAVVALVILVISLFSSSQVVYVFSQSPTPTPIIGQKVDVDYFVPYAGKVTPKSPLWPLKALRDKVWLTFTTNQTKKAEILLLFADKRLAMAQQLMGEENAELSVSTLTKGEKYLEQAIAQEKKARAKGQDTTELLKKLNNSTLKHRQILEELLVDSPEDAKPVIVKTIDMNKRLFEDTKVSLNQVGSPSVENPFKD
jgi:hypothetical protein